MADELDQIQEQEDLLNQLHIQAARGRGNRGEQSLTHCEACGNDIPQGRRDAVPGVRVCVACQQRLEFHSKQYQRWG
ncbi:TraR/DksA C4-type zinc finger protein [Enterobacter cancerogenus]|uniref:TraR/DksA C4-type zinc finger protein n=1 Tax=Enterobacter cancerogenus TaxID=69218 RepID=UPI000C9B3129|nr:conjugal transfer protein TraR [Salmonella enterica]PNC11554.1 conjugal transfer protein TraR [Enterobacter cloacae]HBI6869003.1 TraR/DksA C4-type zinc finger protein [Enterobacter cancerogenus]ECF8133650.1 conjugal transfer protein TraR [Salmonella enterica]EGI1954777.1 conjugal transfer protein TraR [Salmonella enterica]